MKRLILVLSVLLIIALFLVGCQTGTSPVSTSQGSGTTSTQPLSTDDATNVKNGDQQIQDLLPSLDNSLQDANDASDGDQQDTNPGP
jgi:PBP1b-binding outer membrane lipoprotein LpoB